LSATVGVALALLWLGEATASGPPPSPPHPPDRNCIVCHGKQGLEIERSVHATVGLSCSSCHGGVPDSLEVEAAHGDSLKPLTGALESVESCGGCHSDLERMRSYGLRTDQRALYLTSGHGVGLFERGDENVASCVDCHGSHEVRRANDPLSSVHKRNQPETCGKCHSDAELMSQYGLPGDVSERFRESVHGKALLERGHLSSPSCADCHGRHGALPPRVGEVEQVCGHCHSVVREWYDESPHFGATTDDGALVDCIACHGEHDVATPTSALFMGADERHCGSCHAEGDDPGRQAAGELFEAVQHFASTIEEAEAELRVAADRGLYLDSEHGYLDDARGLLVRARTLTHTASTPALADLINRGMGMVLQTRDSLELKQRGLRDRRIFTGLFFALTLVLALVLFLYAREIRGPWWGRTPARDE
jgi:hypothetical protein